MSGKRYTDEYKIEAIKQPNSESCDRAAHLFRCRSASAH